MMIKAQYFPQLLIMGVKNCGTIPFGRYLKIHPDLVNAGETFFFAKTFNKGKIMNHKNLFQKMSASNLSARKFLRLGGYPKKLETREAP